MKWPLTRISIDALALWVAMKCVPGIHSPDTLGTMVFVLILFGMVSALFRPTFWLLTCPIILVTLGPIIVLFNSLILWLSAKLAGLGGLSFTVEGYTSVVLGALFISVIRVLAMQLARFIEDKHRIQKEKRSIHQLQQWKIWLEKEAAKWQRLAADRRISYSVTQRQAKEEQ